MTIHADYKFSFMRFEFRNYFSAPGAVYQKRITFEQFLPAGIDYATLLADSTVSLKSASIPAPVQEDLLKKVSALLASAYKNLATLEASAVKAQKIDDTVKQAETYRDKVIPAMQTLRVDIDALEMLVPADMWPVPTYAELLFKL